LTIKVSQESPDKPSQAFANANRVLVHDYAQNAADFDLTLLGITRMIDLSKNRPSWVYEFTFVAHKRT